MIWIYWNYGKNNLLARLVFQITSLHFISDQIVRLKGGENVPMILVGNKCDVYDEREVSQDEGQQMADRWHCPFYETSAKTRHNVCMMQFFISPHKTRHNVCMTQFFIFPDVPSPHFTTFYLWSEKVGECWKKCWFIFINFRKMS